MMKSYETLLTAGVQVYERQGCVLHAKTMVVDGRLSVTDVCRAVGYSSASHFIKEFRSRFGTTPRAYVDAQALGDQMAALRQA